MSSSAQQLYGWFFVLCLASGAATSLAQDNHGDHDQSSGQMAQGQMSQHMQHMHAMRANRQAQQNTSGQSVMDVISQVVKTLQADENTDWTQVDITALRQHLLDMDRVATSAEAEASAVEGGGSFRVTGPDARTVTAIQRMVPRHAAQIEQELGWTVSTELTSTGVDLRVIGNSDQDVQMIRALGFPGFMVLGEHHIDHHLMMAGGQPASDGAMNHGDGDNKGHSGH